MKYFALVFFFPFKLFKQQSLYFACVWGLSITMLSCSHGHPGRVHPGEISTINYSGFSENQESEIRDSLNLKGVVLPDLEDTTLLGKVYGSYVWKGDHYVHNLGPQLYDAQDSTYMSVKYLLGDERTKMIYLVGVKAYTSVMHNFYNITTLLVNRTPEGWKVADARLDEEVIDFMHVEMAGTYLDFPLIECVYGSVYGGGISVESRSYFFLNRSSLDFKELWFQTVYSNLATNQCNEPNEQKKCTCFAQEGEIDLHFDPNVNALVFNYQRTDKEYDCGVKNEQQKVYNQTWYMNLDTSFQSRGPVFKEYESIPEEKINLSEEEIKRRLGR